MLIKACLNGGRSKTAHPQVPVTPAEVAAAAKAAVAAGAKALHIHPRDADGRETLDPDALAATLSAVRDACPDTPVGISTAAWIVAEVPRRLATMRAWEVTPDFVSVNLSEEGFAEVMAVMAERQIGVEAGVWTRADAARLVSQSTPLLRILIEPMTRVPSVAERTVKEIEAVLDERLPNVPRLLHGQGACAWPMVRLAATRGYDTRIGFEDVIELPSGDRAPSNAALVRAAWQEAEAYR